MTRRLVILTEIIAPYRIPVFNALARHEGIDLHVIFLAESDPGLRQWPVYKSEIRFSYQVLASRRESVGNHKLLLNRGVEESLRRAAPEVILCGGYNYLASWRTLAWARRNAVPFLLWVESTASDKRSGNPIIEWLKSRFMQRCDAFVVPGKSSLQYVRSFSVSESRIFVAPNAVDNDFFARNSAATREDADAQRMALDLPRRFFLFAGRLVPEKGIFDLLEAYGKLGAKLREEIGLVFVGEGGSGPELMRRSRTIIPGAVQFAGFVQREELARFYGLAETFIFPSHSDPWGLVVNEAMACGLPVIASEQAGCTADLVEDQENGRVVASADVNQLAAVMNQVASDSGKRYQMGIKSKERILRYSPEACAAGIASAVLSCGGRGI